MENTKVIGLDCADCPHLLDHIIPLCDLFDAPLLSLDAQNEKLAKKYYPNVEVFPIVSLEDSKEDISKHCRMFIHSNFWFIGLVRDFFQNDQIHSLYTPHGNSDKPLVSDAMKKFAVQDGCLIYGNHMIDFFTERKVYHQFRHPIVMGNIRYRYYKKYKPWFDSIICEKVSHSLDPNKKTLLYAPTFTKISSFFHLNLAFIEALAEKFNIIFKLHPHLADENPELIYPFLGKIEKCKNLISFIELPLVYPLLEISDLYLGDFSSVGYDFLTYNRPMFFISDQNDQRLTALHKCGTRIDPTNPTVAVETILRRLKTDPFKQIREETYRYTFTDIEDKSLKEEVFSKLLTNSRENENDPELV